MATTSESIQEIYVGLLGRAADADGAAYWTAQIDAGTLTLEQLRANIVNLQPEYAAGLGSMTRSEVVSELYMRMFERAADQSDLAYWVDGDGASVNVDQLVLALSNGAATADRTVLNNKVEAAGYFTTNVPQSAYTSSAALAAVDAVDATAASVATSKAATDALLQVEGNTFTLTDGQDTLTGTDANDTFRAVAVDNSNTFESGDFIDGGAGTDTLNIVMGNSAAFAVAAETKNVEVVSIRAQAQSVDSADNDVVDPEAGQGSIDNQVQVDAQDMSGVQQFWSTDSRANLTIEDVRENSHTTTIGMRNTDAGDVNYEVYYDSQHITANDGTTAGSQVYLDILDQLNYPANPLQQHSYKSFSFVFNGQTYTIDGLEGPNTYAELETLVSNAIDALGLGNSLIVTRELNGFSDPNGRTGDRIVISSTEGNDVTAGSFTTGDSKQPGAVDDVYFSLNDQAGTETPALTSTNVIIDNVGRGSKSGDLVVGNMSQSDYSGSAGVQQFDVQVERTSWLDEIRSTNNALEVVNVKNAATFDGGLRVDTLTDVRVFDASDLNGSVNLTATLSEGITAKYLDRKDNASDQSADNSELAYRNVVDKFFSYDMGNNNDTLNLTLSSDNQAAAGNANREDFVLEVNGGTGNDSLTVTIDDATANTGDFWYQNHQENADIVINGDAGDDTIMTTGAGDLTINGGSGNDTVYTDNSGTKAAWVVNANNTDLTNLDSAGVGTTGVLSGATLTVTLSGAAMAAAAGAVQPNASQNVVGYESTVTVTADATGNQATVNQAIKKAINEDAVLSKLLVAEDGPAHTIVITSLVDGNFITEDLTFNVEAVTLANLNDGQQASLQTAHETLRSDSTAVLTQADLDAYANAYDGNLAVLASTGTESIFESNNTIDAGTGTSDVIVLSTGTNSNETIKFTGTGNGKVTVVNFDDAAGSSSVDAFDFSAYLTGMTSASTSTESAVAVPVAYDFVNVTGGTATASANEVIVINDFVSTTGETFADLTQQALLAAIQNNTSSYGNIDSGDLTVAAAPANFVGSTMKHIIMVENDTNQGEYKVFEVTSDVGGDFTAATMITTLDLGATFNMVDDGPTPTYALAPAAASVNEGATVDFTLTTTNVADGTDVAYTIAGVDAADVTGGLTGTVTVNGGTATISVALAADATTEGAEALTVTVGNTTSTAVTVNDTSIDGGATGGLEVTGPAITATDAADVITFDATDVSTGQYTITGFDTAADSLSLAGLTGADGTTLADLAGDTIGTGVIGVQIDQIAQSTFVNLGQDANGDVISIEIAGVTDASLVNIALV